MPSKKIITLLAAAASLVALSVSAAELPNVRVKPLPGTVTLTFDDGPSPVYTPKVLAILKKYNIHATFFVMAGAAKAHPEVIKQIIADGNIVASHSITHPLLNKLSDEKLQHEVGDSKKMISDISGAPVACLRPPHFGTNARVRESIKNNNMYQILGFMTEDYSNKGVGWLTNNVLTHVHSGAVLVMHDGYRGRDQTVAALPGIIEGIKKKGLGFSMICQPAA